MKLSNRKPDIYEKCKRVFGVDWDRGVIITYGDTVYCKVPISDALIVHEQTHIDQQKAYGVEAWWDRYFVDVEFRLSQEVEAYRNQVKYMREHCPRAERRRLLALIYKDMARMYGGMCTEEEAERLLA